MQNALTEPGETVYKSADKQPRPIQYKLFSQLC